MSYSEELEKEHERIRNFVYWGLPQNLGDSVIGGCLQPAVDANYDGMVDVDRVLLNGLGGEITRFAYWKGLLMAFGAPPIDTKRAIDIIGNYSTFSELLLPRERTALTIFSSVNRAYEKGYSIEYGDIV